MLVFPQRPLSACQLMTRVVGKQTGYLLGNWTGRTIKQQAFNEVPVTREQSTLFWPHRSGKNQPIDPIHSMRTLFIPSVNHLSGMHPPSLYKNVSVLQ